MRLLQPATRLLLLRRLFRPPRVASMPVIKHTIDLTTKERDVFHILKTTNEHYDLGVTLRCAGGWVRDKLLGRHSDDIDVALDIMLGADFAEKVNEYLRNQGEQIHEVAVIETNPEQSKHLETARIKIHGIQIDLVNLRSETYTQTSRVPQMNFGSPTEDAYRRDLTINSMFYNINEALIEDFTELGLEDLKNGWIRTPLPPMETFLDDPLRVLRSIRFAARFNFQIDPQLLRAAASDRVRDALRLKISRERIGTEIDGMFRGQEPALAVNHLVDLSLFPIVFLLPENLDVIGYGPMCLATLSAACHILHACGETLESDERRLFLLTALLAPIQLLKGPHASGKGTRRFSPASAHVVWEGLKWKNKDGAAVVQLHEMVPQLLLLYNKHIYAAHSNGNGSDEFEGNVRVELGLWVRQMKELWKLGILLAPVFSMKESLPLGIVPNDYLLHEFVQTFNTPVNDNNQSEISDEHLTIKRLALCNDIRQWISDYGLENAWKLKPLLDGKKLISELSLKNGGPLIGDLLSLATKWQLAHPTGSAEECLMFLKEAHRTGLDRTPTKAPKLS